MAQNQLAVLALAIRNEKMGMEFYAEAARRSPDERGRNTFRNLADMEEEHLRLLLAEYEAARKEEGWLPAEEALKRGKEMDINRLPEVSEVPEGVLLPPYIFPSPEEAPGIKGDIAALEYALKMEERSYEIYKDAMEKSADPLAKGLYARLMEEENRHYKLLQEAHAYLTANETWWDDWQKPFFEG